MSDQHTAIDLGLALDGGQPETATPEPEATPEPQPEPAQEVEQQAEPAPAQPAPETPQPHQDPAMVPVSVVQALRHEIRALKEAGQQPEPQPAPDFYENPQAAIQHHMQPVQQQLDTMRLNMSEQMAIQTHGQDAVTAAFQALQAKEDQPAYQAIMSARSPYHALVDWHKQQQVAQEIGSDPAAYRAKVEAEVRAQIEAEAVAKQAQELAAKAPASLAETTGTGGSAAQQWAGPTSLDAIL